MQILKLKLRYAKLEDILVRDGVDFINADDLLHFSDDIKMIEMLCHVVAVELLCCRRRSSIERLGNGQDWVGNALVPLTIPIDSAIIDCQHYFLPKSTPAIASL